jgi:hypothetical protein
MGIPPEPARIRPLNFPVSGGGREADPFSFDFNRRFGIGQFLYYFIVFEMDYVDAAPRLSFSLKAAFQRRPIKAPSVKDFLQPAKGQYI